MLKKTKQLKNCIKNEKPGTKFKRLGFVGRDFHENRPSGQLSIRFFKLLAKYTDQFEYFFIVKKGNQFPKYLLKLEQ